jgi:HPt (histidine-containing phosphotransfer) domain-containing protein
MPGALPRIAGLDTARGLALFAGRHEVYLHALRTCVSIYAAGLPALDARLAHGSGASIEALRAQVHAVGGACAAIGAVDVEAQAQAIDKLLRDANLGVDEVQLVRMLQGLRSSLAALVQQLRDKLPPLEPAAALRAEGTDPCES